ncbi:hypothetical protein [Aquimarina rubra]|uniref:Uncharacterized protein n=1 Tax=Aquimarina rubra TaxID=1920033 RepID=A0ABW5LDC5_9FLAO
MDKRDEILKFLRENKSKSFTQREIQKEVFPNLNQDQVKHLLDQIILHQDDLMWVSSKKYNSGLMPVKYSGLIDEFLSKGGFTQIEFDLETERLKKKRTGI